MIPPKQILSKTYMCASFIVLWKKHVNLIINIWRNAETLKEPIQRPREATRASMRVNDITMMAAECWPKTISKGNYDTLMMTADQRLFKGYKQFSPALRRIRGERGEVQRCSGERFRWRGRRNQDEIRKGKSGGCPLWSVERNTFILNICFSGSRSKTFCK